MPDDHATMTMGVEGWEKIIKAMERISAEAKKTGTAVAKGVENKALNLREQKLLTLLSLEAKLNALKKQVTSRSKIDEAVRKTPAGKEKHEAQVAAFKALSSVTFKLREEMKGLNLAASDAMKTIVAGSGRAAQKQRDLANIQKTLTAGIVRFTKSAKNIKDFSFQIATLTQNYNRQSQALSSINNLIAENIRLGKGTKGLETQQRRLLELRIKTNAELSIANTKLKTLISTANKGTGQLTQRQLDLAQLQKTISAGMLKVGAPATGLDAASRRVALITQRYQSQSKALAAVNRLMAENVRLGRGTKGLERQQRKILESYNKTGVELSRAKGQLRSFYAEAKKGGKTWIQGLVSQQKAIQDIGSRLGIAIQKIITYRIAFGIWRQGLMQLRDVFDQTIKIDDAMQDLRKVMQASQPVFDRLQDSAFNFGIKFGRSINEVISGFKVFAQQGLSADEIMNRMNATLLAVSGSTLSTTEAVEALTAVVKNFPAMQARVTDAVDKWTRVAATAPVTAQDLANAVKQVGVAASEAGVSLDELNGIVAAVAEVTRKTGNAIGTSFKTIFARFPRKKTIEALQTLGVSSLKSAGQMRDFASVMSDLKKKWGTLSDIQRKNFAQTIGGIRRYNDFIALMNNYDTFLKETTESQFSFGFAEKASAAETEKLKRQIQAVGTQYEKLKVSIGKGGLTDSLMGLLKIADKVLVSWTANSEVIAGLIIGLAKFITIGGSLFVIITTLLGALQKLNTTLFASATAAEFANKSMVKFANTARFALGAFGMVAIGITVAITAWQLFSAATDKSAESMDKFNKAMDEHNQKMAQMNREAAAAGGAGALKRFEQIQRIDQLSADLSEYTSRLHDYASVQSKITKILASRRRVGESTAIRFPVRGETSAERNARALTIVNNKLGTSYGDVQQAIDKLHDSKTIEQLNMQVLKASIAYQKGTTDIDAYLKAKQNLEGFRITQHLADLKKLRKEIGVTGLLPTEIIKKFKDILGEDVPIDKLTIRIKVLFEEIERGEFKLKSLRDLFTSIGKDDSTFIMRDNFSKTSQTITEIAFKIKGLEGFLNRGAKNAELFGESFDRLGVAIKGYKTALTGIRAARTKLAKERAVSDADLRANLLLEGTTEKEILGLLGDKMAISKKIGELSAMPTEAGLQQPEAIKRLDNYFRILTEILNTEEKLNKEEERYLRLSKIATDLLKERLTAVNILKQKDAERAALMNRQKNHIISFDITQKGILNTELKRLEVEEAIERRVLEQERDAARILDIKQGTKTVLDLELKLTALTTKYLSKQLAIHDKIRLKVAQNIVNIKKSLVDALAGGIGNVPLQLVTRTEDLDRLRAEEKDAIRELTRARRAGDAAATNQAIENLRRIKFEMEDIGNLFPNLFQPFLEQLMNIRMENLSEIISNALIGGGAGDIIAQGITTASVTGAQLYYDAIVAATKAKDFDAAQELADKELGSFNAKSALKAGAIFGAQMWGQIIAGGGKNAALFANLGGIMGQAAAEKFLASSLGSFAGPLGALAGSILGGLFGKSFDRNFEAMDTNTTAVNRNTVEIKNNNQLLALQREFINAPTNFRAPPSTGNFGGNSPINLQVVIDRDGNVDANIMDDFSTNNRLVGTQTRRFSIN